VVPPVAVAVKLRELPTEPVPGPLIETLSGGIDVDIDIIEEAVVVFPLASVVLTLKVKVPDLV